MANIQQDNAKTQYVSGSPDYLLNTYDRVQNLMGSPKFSNQLPFYISMVDSDGSLVSLTLPPVADPIMNIKKGKWGVLIFH